MTDVPKGPGAPRVSLLFGRTWLILSLGAAIAIGAGGAWLGHWAWGALAGFGFLIASASMLAWLATPSSPPAVHVPSGLERDLGGILQELETVRAQVRRRIRRRAWLMVPLGMLVGFGGWLGLRYGDRHPPDYVLLATLAFFGGYLGHALASRRLAGEYARTYKSRILPRIAALFGDLTYARAARPDVARLKRFHVFRDFDRADAEDAIVGSRRGVPVSITQLRLSRRSGLFERKAVFRGLLAEVTLRNPLLGITGVGPDEGAFGAWRDSLSQNPQVRRVGLEDPDFEKDYEVWSTDQVMARALLTPDFMERLREIPRETGYGKPLALAQDSQLIIALPRLGLDDLFKPPAYDRPASDADLLRSFKRDIEIVLRAVDTVIDLDGQTARAADKA